MLPKTIDWTFTAVPQAAGMLLSSRYLIARAFIQEEKTAPTAPQSWARGSCGKSLPSAFRTISLYLPTRTFQSSAPRSVSRCRPLRSL